MDPRKWEYGKPMDSTSPESLAVEGALRCGTPGRSSVKGVDALASKEMAMARAPLDGPPASSTTSAVAPAGSNAAIIEQLMQMLEAGKGLDASCKKSVYEVLTTWQTLPEEVKAQLKFLLNTFYRAPHDASAPHPFKPLNGYLAVRPEPLPRAPENVFVFRRASDGAPLGWRNVFQLPIQYDVELCRGGVLSADCTALATRLMPASGDLRRRFLVVDAAVQELYGAAIVKYFDHHGIEVHTVVLPGEECNKRMEAVDAILEQLCVFGLLRREPIIGIGGGVLLDIVGLAANLYRRGVPYIRVPTTLLALVDASVGVKNGVDYCSCACGPQKNRVGSFYAPAAALLDKTFIATQDARNVVNGLGEVMKLALVRSAELFCLLEAHGARLVRERFQGADPVADRVIELSIQIMLEELGPNLWEEKLERCVDYGHTFSKILEMEPGADLMHGEAVNVDGALCVVLAANRGLISAAVRDRVFAAMRGVGLPTLHPAVTPAALAQGLADAVQHRNGAQRIPLLTGIGAAVCVNDITPAELEVACAQLWAMHA